MRVVLQRVAGASVTVNGGEARAIGPGLALLVGIKDTDTLDLVPKLAEKCAHLRIFADEEGKLNRSAAELGYSALVVSNFTLYANTKKGKRPSFIAAAKPPLAVDAYELFFGRAGKAGPEGGQARRIWGRHAGFLGERRPGHHSFGHR